MALHLPGSETERHTSTIIQEPLATYSDAPGLPCNLMTYTNYSSSSGSYSNALEGNTQQQHSNIDILSEASNSNQSEQVVLPELGGPRIDDHDLNEWKNNRNSMLLMTHVGDAASVLRGPQNIQGQGLSLSLSTHVPSGFPMPSLQCHSPNPGYFSFLGAHPSMPEEDTYRNGYFENMDSCQSKQLRQIECVSPGFPRSSSDTVRSDVSQCGMPSTARAVPNSNYLKAAQQLLDEVVNVKKALKEQHSRNGMMKDSKEVDGGSKNGDSDHPGSGSSLIPQESNSKSPIEISASEKQDLLNKMSKLLAMLDEVDRRYKQYFHQMQVVVSSFDVIAGSGAARPYTALALQTISRHFRCLRDAISDQVQLARTSLGEQDAPGNSQGIGISRLRYVDQQIKQQKALHQLGLMQQHAWRPQRGLPESSVTVLRAWLFEHFLHPYPRDSDKIMLARQTGLTRSQVSNWFINARVRLWKPMVEEMYKEETVDIEMDSSSPSNAAAKTTNSDIKASEDTSEDLLESTISTATERCSTGQLFESKSDQVADVEVEPFQTASHTELESKYGFGQSKVVQKPAVNDYSISPDTTIIQSSEGSGRFMAAAVAAYHMSELERFDSGSGVSLTLGLQHCDESSVPLPMSIQTPHGYMPMRGNDMYNGTASSTVAQASEFHYMDSGNRNHRLGSSQLFHDFVA